MVKEPQPSVPETLEVCAGVCNMVKEHHPTVLETSDVCAGVSNVATELQPSVPETSDVCAGVCSMVKELQPSVPETSDVCAGVCHWTMVKDLHRFRREAPRQSEMGGDGLGVLSEVYKKHLRLQHPFKDNNTIFVTTGAGLLQRVEKGRADPKSAAERYMSF